MSTGVDLNVIPVGGWTPENMKAYREEWWRLEMSRPWAAWEDVEDPEHRLKKGQRIRWRHATHENADMELIRLCAPGGLYRRPLRASDDVELFPKGTVPCSREEDGARYDPTLLKVFFRYLSTDQATTADASALIVVADTVPNGRARLNSAPPPAKE
jgi:hypothetical protein